MSIVKINAITVPPDSGDELGRRFAARQGAVDGQPGFDGFELLQPTDGRNTWLVITRWKDEESFEAWTAGQDFAKAHAGTSGESAPADHGHGHGHGHAEGQGGAPSGGDAPKKPVGMSAELWSFSVSTGSTGHGEQA